MAIDFVAIWFVANFIGLFLVVAVHLISAFYLAREMRSNYPAVWKGLCEVGGSKDGRISNVSKMLTFLDANYADKVDLKFLKRVKVTYYLSAFFFMSTVLSMLLLSVLT